MYKQFFDHKMSNNFNKTLGAVEQVDTFIHQHPDYYVQIVGAFLHNGYEFILLYYQDAPQFQFAPLKLYRQFFDDNEKLNPHYTAVQKLNGWVKLHPHYNVHVVRNFINHMTGCEFILVAYQRNN